MASQYTYNKYYQHSPSMGNSQLSSIGMGGNNTTATTNTSATSTSPLNNLSYLTHQVQQATVCQAHYQVRALHRCLAHMFPIHRQHTHSTIQGWDITYPNRLTLKMTWSFVRRLWTIALLVPEWKNLIPTHAHHFHQVRNFHITTCPCRVVQFLAVVVLVPIPQEHRLQESRKLWKLSILKLKWGLVLQQLPKISKEV